MGLSQVRSMTGCSLQNDCRPGWGLAAAYDLDCPFPDRSGDRQTPLRAERPDPRRYELWHDLAPPHPGSAEPRGSVGGLQAAAPCSSAQTYDWAKASARHLLGPEGREPVIAVACADDGRPLFLWPFEMAPAAGMKVLRWLGQDHANYNMGLFAPEAAPKFTANDLSRLLAEVARKTGAVAAILRAQPFSWDGMANPFAAPAHAKQRLRGHPRRLCRPL
jgi:hypothetical protein